MIDGLDIVDIEMESKQCNLETNIDNYIESSLIENYLSFIHYNKRIIASQCSKIIPIPFTKNELYDLQKLREKEKYIAKKQQYIDFLQHHYFSGKN